MGNPLRSPDPDDPFSPTMIINESDTGTRHPSRFESRTSSIPDTQLVRHDFARVYRNAALSVATGNLIGWDTKTTDTTGIWNGSTGFIIPSTGKISGPWKAKAQIVWPGTGAGVNRQIELRRNGAVVTTKAGPAITTYQDIEDDFFDLSRNDLFTLTVAHDAGGVLALTVGSPFTFFSMVHTG